MKKFLIIFSLVIMVGLGYLLGWVALPKPKAPEPMPAPQVVNKFFEFIDQFTVEKEMGSPTVLLYKPESDLVVFRYGSSQESSQFGVYNYTTNELFTGIGTDNYIANQHPVAILGNDRLLMWSSPGVDALATDKPKLEIVDFKNTLIATVRLPITMLNHFHEGHGFSDSTGKGFITVKNTFDHTPTTKYETWEIDTNTLTLSKSIPKG